MSWMMPMIARIIGSRMLARTGLACICRYRMKPRTATPITRFTASVVVTVRKLTRPAAAWLVPILRLNG